MTNESYKNIMRNECTELDISLKDFNERLKDIQTVLEKHKYIVVQDNLKMTNRIKSAEKDLFRVINSGTANLEMTDCYIFRLQSHIKDKKMKKDSNLNCFKKEFQKIIKLSLEII